MNESEKRKYRVCFTGHRPEKLSTSEEFIKQQLYNEIIKSIQDGFNVFISGMARGVDIWASEIVLQLKNDGYPIKLICALPYDGFENNWSVYWQNKYNLILSRADLVRCISTHYSPDCFKSRNEWMVNHSSRVIAVYNGKSGGTRNTIYYASTHNIPVHIISDNI